MTPKESVKLNPVERGFHKQGTPYRAKKHEKKPSWEQELRTRLEDKTLHQVGLSEVDAKLILQNIEEAKARRLANKTKREVQDRGKSKSKPFTNPSTTKTS